MQTTRILRFFFALFAAISLSSTVKAGTIFTDDFESGNLLNWTTTGSSPLTIAAGTNVVPAGGANAALVDTSADRMHRNIITDNGGSEIAGHTVFSYWFYDNAGTATRVFNEIRAYTGTGLPNGGITADGTLSQLIAFGKYNSVTLPGDTAFNVNKYQARVGFTTNATIYWFNLDGVGSPNRSVGWHKFTMEREAAGGTIHFYVDGILARTVTDAVVASFDSLVLGFGAGSTVGDGWIDGIELSSGAPTITAHPQAATVVAGGNVSFSVTQIGGTTYQWTHAGTNIPNANVSTLNLSGVHDGNAGDYAVIVGNTAGTTTSSIASLSVTHLPDVVFVSDNGPAGFSGPLAGTVDDAFVILLQNAGHNVIRFNSDNSAAVLLTPEQITALNTNELIILGRSLGSAAFAAGQGTQWNVDITKPIIVQSAFLIRSGQLGWFVGSDANNRVPMPLTAVSPSDPENAYLFAGTALNGATTVGNFDEAGGQGTSHTFDNPVAGASVLATGFVTNKVIVEFPAGTLVKGGVDTLGGYRMFFASGNREPSGGTVPQAGNENLTAAGESIFLRAVKLALNGGVAPNLGETPTITTQPAGANACVGLPLNLSVTATGQDPLSYQWYFSDGATFTNAVGTGTTLSFPSFDTTNAGFYAVVVTNAVGVVTSSVAVVTVAGTGTVASALISLTNCPGTPAVFTTTATGSGTLTYTWRKNGTIVQGPDAQNSYTIAAAVLADAGTYSVEVAGQCNTVTNTATLTVITAPVITAQPQNQTTPMGNGAVFSVTATGAGLTYQWLSNGVPVAGATGSSLAVSNLTLAHNGDAYSVIASNCAGPVTSVAAVLNVTVVSGISFDFNTPGQYTNAPYYLYYNNWINNGYLPNQSVPMVHEMPYGGVGPFPGGGGLDLAPNQGTENTSILLPVNFDFSLPGKAVYASTMFKLKSPITAGRRATQFGLISATNLGINDVAGQSFATVIVQAPTALTPTYELRTQRRSNGGGLQESVVTGLVPLTLSNWYKLNIAFINTRDLSPSNYTIMASLQDMGPLGTTPGATNLSFTTTTNTADIVNFKNVSLALRSFEDGGVEARDNTYVWTTPGNVFFVQEPVSVTVPQGDRANFRSYVDGEGQYTYTWQRSDGVGGFTNIPLAGSWNHITPPARTTDNGAQFRVVVDGPVNSITSAPVTLTVTSEALAVVSAGSVDGTTVGVLFNQPVNPITAENPANYLINGVAAEQARVYRTSLGPLGPEGIYVVLTPASVLAGAFTVTVSGVQDLSGGTVGVANSAAGTVAGLISYDVNPAITGPAGEDYSFGPGQFIVWGGGVDIFSGADAFHYVYTTRTGDFDITYKIPYVDTVRFTAKAGIDARYSLDPSSPGVLVAFNPGPAAEGSSATYRQYTEGTAKQTWGAAGTSWGTNRRLFPPDVWLRFRRAGNTFLRYSSTDGVTWLFDGQITPTTTPPDTIYVGLAVCSARNLYGMSAQFENVTDFGGYSGAVIAITSQPTNFTAAAGSTFTDGVVATVTGGGAPAAGELTYVWQRSNGSGGFTNLPNSGATNNTIAIGPLWSSDSGAIFRVVVKAPGASDVISSTFTATVTDTALPTVASVNAVVTPSYPISEVVINFSELLADGAINIANFTVTNASGTVLTVLSAEFLNGDRRTILVRVDGQLGTGTSGVGISGVQDLNGNTIATTARTFRTFAPGVGPVVHEVYMDIAAGVTVPDLTGHALFTAQQPTLTVYSNLFGFNVGINASTIPRLTYTLGTTAGDNYGVKSYTYFVPPTNGQYKFWLRADDSMRLLMNTNGTDPAGKTLIAELTAVSAAYIVGTTPASSITNITLTAGQPYYMEVLMKEGGGNDGFSVMWTAPGVVTAPAATAFIPTANLAYPAAAALAPKAISEIYSAYPDFVANRAVLAGIAEATNYPSTMTQIRSANFNYVAGLPNGTQPNPAIGYHPYFGMQPTTPNTRWDDYLGKLYSYFVAPSNGTYKFWLRVDDVATFYMNTNAVDSTDPNGKKLLGQTANAFVTGAPYQLVGSNITLAAGQRYYMETLWKEGGGGDGVAVVVRANNDNVAPPTTAPMIPDSMLEFPAGTSRSGAVKFDGIAPAAGTALTVADGETLLLSVAGLKGAPPYGGFTWYKNGVKVLENSFTNVTPPLTMADNGAVYTLVVTNLFSSTSRSATLTVLPDTNAPAVISSQGFRNGDGFSIVYSEPMDAESATYLGNYTVSGGLQLLNATLDATRRIVSIQTAPQTAGTTYLVTISGVTDASSSATQVAPGTQTSFSTWAVGGSGFLVELFTNIVGSTIGDLVGTVKFAANVPDVVYYTNSFGVGAFGANTGLENYGARITGMFVPTNTGLYRFYTRQDDAAMVFLNYNSTDSENPNGKTMIVHSQGANISFQDPRSISPPIPLNAGQRYYMETLFKEGTGGDYMMLTFRNTDENGTALGSALVDTVAELQQSGPSWNGVPGNPDAIQITGIPPSELTVSENDAVSLAIVHNRPANMLLSNFSYQWQRFDGASFTNIPGANGPAYNFFAPLTDNNRQIRLIFSAPGVNTSYTTLMHVNSDTNAPYIVSASSLDGNTIGVLFNEPVDPNTAGEASNYYLNGDTLFNPLSAVVRTNIDPRTVLLTMGTPLVGSFQLDATFMSDFATNPNFGDSTVYGTVQNLTPLDVGAPPGPGSSFSVTNGEIDVIAGGADIWGTSDQGHLTVGLRTGNFDIWARLDSLSRGALDNDGITKAGIMVRETLDANAKKLHYLAEPPAAVGGRDIIEAGQRPAVNAATAAWAGGNGNTGVPAGIPNAWVRIKRVGDLFTAYRSSNGVDWIATTTQFMSLSNTVYVGLAATAHLPTAGANPTGTTTAKFRNVHVPNPPTITVQPVPDDQSVGLGGNTSYSVTATNPPNSGALTYQWFRNGLPISGATGSTLNLVNLSGADSGTYFVRVGNDGGQVTSESATLLVDNAAPVVGADSINVTPDTAFTFPAANLIANDSDPESGPLAVVAVSGLMPATFSTDFNSGVPSGSQVFAGALGGGIIDTTGGVNDSGVLKLTFADNDDAGAFVLDELTPGRRVSAFTANFMLRIGNGSAEPADGFSFNFAPDLPIAAGGGENGFGTGLSFAVDNYRFLPAPCAGTPVANTHCGLTEAANSGGGLKLIYGGMNVAAVPIPTWNSPRFVSVSISVTTEGQATVLVDGTNVFGTIALPGYIPKTGRFGFYARNGGQNQAQWVDDLSIAQVLTVETAREPNLGASMFGTTYIDGGALHITDAVNSQQGAFVISNLTPGSAVTAFNASFGLQIGSGSADGADGISFNFAGDLPNAVALGEDGVGGGLSICFDNYSGGTVPAGPAIRVKYAGAFISSVQIPKWNSPNFIPVTVTLDADGTVDVVVDGTNVFANLATPYTPAEGRFGFYGRTGGLNQRHWIDNLSIAATTAGSPGSYSADFNSPAYATVTLTNGVVTYIPQANGCGTDTFYYLVNDGQVGGTSVGAVNVNIVCGPVGPITLILPVKGANTFTASFNTEAGVNYQVRYKDNISAPTWTTLTVISGDGTVKSFTDNGPLPPTRFYQIFVP